MPSYDDLVASVVSLEMGSRRIETAIKDRERSVAEAREIACDAIRDYLKTQPDDVETVSLPMTFARNLKYIWAAQYRWKKPEIWQRFDAYVDYLLDGSGWTVVRSGTSELDPRVEDDMAMIFVKIQRRTSS